MRLLRVVCVKHRPYLRQIPALFCTCCVKHRPYLRPIILCHQERPGSSVGASDGSAGSSRAGGSSLVICPVRISTLSSSRVIVSACCAMVACRPCTSAVRSSTPAPPVPARRPCAVSSPSRRASSEERLIRYLKPPAGRASFVYSSRPSCRYRRIERSERCRYFAPALISIRSRLVILACASLCSGPPKSSGTIRLHLPLDAGGRRP
ncbi:MAG: hypothetical protein BWY77_01800 [bacterium ADurb.Bin431]|nr:MAG: hypothetical protein BWY77_01800 [bacterium ADurb.Bin431]